MLFYPFAAKQRDGVMHRGFVEWFDLLAGGVEAPAYRPA